MSEWRNTFRELWPKTQELFQKDKTFYYQICVVLSVISFISVILGWYDINSQGLSIFENAVDYQESTNIIIINFILGIIMNFTLMTLIVFTYFKIIGAGKSFSDSFKYFISRFVPFLLTSIIMVIFLIPLYLLFIIPGVIFSILWYFMIYAVLFRDKKYMSALSYSKSLVSGKKMMQLNCYISVLFSLWIFWLVPGIIHIGINIYAFSIGNAYLLYLPNLIFNIFYNVITVYTIIFSALYFLKLEELAGISNVAVTSSTPPNAADVPSTNLNQDTISDEEKMAKDYITQNKSQFSRESLKKALVNNGSKVDDVENYLNKYY